MRFAAPWAFILLLVVPAYIFANIWLARIRRRRLARAGDPGLLQQMALIGRSAPLIRAVQIALTSLALTLLAVSLARPQFGLRTEVRRARGMDVVIALDLSKSMLVQDVVPSRLARARIELSDLVDQLRGDRIGLLGFTSLPLPLCPLTADRAVLKLQLKAASPDDLPRGGTAIGLAIEEALRMLDNARSTGASRAIIIVTDGEEHEGDPVAAARKAAAAGVQVHVVGVGSQSGDPIPIREETGRTVTYLKDRSGRRVFSRLNAELLRDVAEAGMGLAALPGQQGGIDLNPVRRHLATLKRSDMEDRRVRVYRERFQWFLVPSVVLLMLASVLRPGKSRRRWVVAGLTAFSLVLLAPAPPANAQGAFESEDPDVAAGNAALEAGKATEAVQAYQRAKQRLGDSAGLTYNRALADAARGELEPAIEGYKTAASLSEDPRLRAKAQFALGNALRRTKKYDEALEAYQQALLADPSLEAARRNYELTQRMKAVKAAQPKSEDPSGEPDPDNQDGDAGAGDGGPSDGGGQNQNDSPDAGLSDAEGEGFDSGASSAGDAGHPEDAAPPPPPPSPAEEPPPEEEVDRQQAEAILDALQDREEALKRERLLKRFRGRAVEKDW